MNIVVLTNDNFFSFTVLKKTLEQRREDIKLIVFSSALIGKRGTFSSIAWSLRHTGLRHTGFKLLVYGVFRMMKVVCELFPFVPNEYSSRLWVRRNSMPFVDAPDINSPDIVQWIKTTDPDLIVSVSMNQIVKKELLEIPTKKCINVHCAPLPRYAGMSPYVWALANKENHSAATIHYMEKGLDEGDIIAQEKEPVLEKDSAFCLFYRCCLRAARLLISVVDKIEAGHETSRPQDLSKKMYCSWPDRECIKALHKNGYTLATFTDFVMAVFRHNPRLRLKTQQRPKGTVND